MNNPAGWYPSPDGMPVDRFWDGSQWTQHQRVRGFHSAGGNPLTSDPFQLGPTTVGASPFQPMTAPPRGPSDFGRIERGSDRWIVGLAMLILSVVLSLSSFAVWAQLAYSASDGNGGQLKVSADLSGWGAVTAFVPDIRDSAERRAVEDLEASALEAEGPKVPGIAVLAVGATMALAALMYLNTRHRFRSALAIAILAVLGLVNGLWRLTNVRGMFNDPAGWSHANYSPGFGLIAATVAALLLAGLGVTALILERRSPSPVAQVPLGPS